MPSSSRGRSSSENYNRKRQKSQRRSKAFEGGSSSSRSSSSSSSSSSSGGGKHSSRRGTSSRHRREQHDGEAGCIDEGQSGGSPGGNRPVKSTMAKHHELVQSIVDVETGDDFLDSGLNEDFDDDVQTDDDIETICEMLRRPGLPCVCTGLILLTLLSWLRNWAFGFDPSLKKLETGSVTPRFPKGFDSQAQETFIAGGAGGSPSPPPTHGLHVAEGAFESNWHNSAGGNYAPFASAGQQQQSSDVGGGGGGPMWAADGYPAATGGAPAASSAEPFFAAPQLAAPDINALFQAPSVPDFATTNAWSLPPQQASPPTDVGADPGTMSWSNMQASTEAGFPASFAGGAQTGTWTSSAGAVQRRGRRAILLEANKRPPPPRWWQGWQGEVPRSRVLL